MGRIYRIQLLNMKDKEEEERVMTRQFLAWTVGTGDGTIHPGEIWKEEQMWGEK